MELIKYQDYTREDIHSIFSPETNFSSGAGTWGAHGIIKVPNRPNDFVFIITYGQSQGGHVFDEGITSDGVLSWQSQPSQDFQEARIIQFINHDEELNNIYLFLRTKANIPYTYLGNLKYLKHDSEREKPVYFQWQILDWNEIDNPTITRMELQLTDGIPTQVEQESSIEKNFLDYFEPPQSNHKDNVVGTNTFRAHRGADYSHQDRQNRALGLKGELLVLKYEKERLIDLGRPDLADKVIHASKTIGDGCGYDILSFNDDESERFIEVKTTKGGKTTEFYLSSNELEYSKVQQDSYYLYRVYDYKNENNTGKVFVVSGSINDNFNLKPTQFKARR